MIFMKKLLFSMMCFLVSATIVAQQKDSTRSSGFNGLLKKANQAMNSGKSNAGSSLSTDEIVAGLREALAVGAEKSAGRLSAMDGFFKDAAVKILMPEDVRKLEGKLRAVGMGKLVDETIVNLNRAAEDASKAAAPIFIDAIKKMSVQDAIGILRGKDTAATSYLKRVTSNELTNSFRPVIEGSLKKVDATRYWKDVFDVYNRFSATPVTSDINEYVTERALRGIFYYIGEEEKKIRSNPAARASDILKKVFGG